MRLAAVGCVHGELTRAFNAVRNAGGADAVIMCGDVQACRTEADLISMSVPAKYRRMGDFHEYYSGARKAPYLTIVVGGNHEASAHFAPLSETGGWLAPNIWYIGDVGLVEVDGVRIAGISGIYFEPDADVPRFEPQMFAETPKEASESPALYSAYHTRRAAIEKAKQFTGVDVLATHDWPQGIEKFGDTKALLSHKPWFKSDVAKGSLGSPLTRPLLDVLQPQWWLSAHLHTYFRAKYGRTEFVALDKVIPRRKFLEFIDIQPSTQTVGPLPSPATVLR